MKKFAKILSLILVVTMLFSLAACGGENGGKDEKTPIYFANYAVLEKNYTEYWNKIEMDFEAKYPEYDVQYLTAAYNDMMTYVSNRVGGGDTVDLIFGEVAWAPELAEAGITDPIKDILSEDYIKDFYPSIIDSFKYDGEYYGMPCYYSTSVLYINKDYAEQVGLDVTNPPKTQAELMAWAEKLSVLKKDGEKVFAMGIPYAEKTAPGAFLNAVITAAGGTLLDDNGNLSIDNKGFDEAVDFLIELDQKGYNPKNTLPKNLREMFANGTVAMFMDQTGSVSAVRNINPDADFIHLAPFPSLGTSGQGKTLVHSHSFTMKNNGEKSAEGTRKLVEFIVSTEGMSDYLRNVAPYFPAKTSMENIELDPIISTVESSKMNVQAQINLPEMNGIHIELAKMINAINTSGKSKADAVAEFKKQVEILLR